MKCILLLKSIKNKKVGLKLIFGQIRYFNLNFNCKKFNLKNDFQPQSTNEQHHSIQ